MKILPWLLLAAVATTAAKTGADQAQLDDSCGTTAGPSRARRTTFDAREKLTVYARQE